MPDPDQPSHEQPPAWADFFTAGQYAQFMRELTEYFDRRGLEIAVANGVARIRSEQWGGPADAGLLNLAQACRLSPPEQWRSLIAHHFDILEGAVESQEQVVATETLDDVCDRLAVRLWPEDAADSLGRENLVYRVDVPGTLTTLVLDLPTSVRTLRPEEVRRWSGSVDHLMRIGLDNVLAGGDVESIEEHLPGGGRILALTGQSFFVASRALALETLDGFVGQYGSVVAVPHRHAMLSAPIDDLSVVNALTRIIPAAYGMHQEGPGSITPNIYWYVDGEFMTLPYEVEDEKINFLPPDEFTAMLNELGGEGWRD